MHHVEADGGYVIEGGARFEPLQVGRIIEIERQLRILLVHFLGEALWHGQIGIRELRENHVGARRRISLGASDRFIKAATDRSHCIGACNDDEIRIASCVTGGADLAGGLFERDHLLASDVAAAFRADLVFDVDGGDTGVFKIAHGAHDVNGIAVAGIGVRDHRDADRARDVAGVGRHLLAGDEADIGQTEQG